MPESYFNRSSQHTQDAYKQCQAAPKGLLPKATLAKCPPSTDPDPTEPTKFTPTQWAQKTLALNISLAPAKHIQRASATANRTNLNKNDDHLLCLANPLFGAKPPDPMNPLPTTFLQPA